MRFTGNRLQTKQHTPMGQHNEFGKEGEQIAADFLLKKGYTIAYRNYRYLKGEIDIIAQKDGVVAIVEVRSRRSDAIIPIAETVTQKKIQLLVRTADYYIVSNDINAEVRFDIITILKNSKRFDIEHLENAFYHF